MWQHIRKSTSIHSDVASDKLWTSTTDESSKKPGLRILNSLFNYLKNQTGQARRLRKEIEKATFLSSRENFWYCTVQSFVWRHISSSFTNYLGVMGYTLRSKAFDNLAFVKILLNKSIQMITEFDKSSAAAVSKGLDSFPFSVVRAAHWIHRDLK